MRGFLILLLCSAPAWATAYTSAKSGNWSDRTVWSPDPGAGNYPGKNGAADTVTISAVNGGHVDAVTVDVDVTIGNSGAPVHSYVHSVTTTGASGYTTCTSATISGGTKTGSSNQTATCTVVGGVPVVSLQFPRRWYTSASAAPTATTNAAGGSGAIYTVNWQQGGGTAAIYLPQQTGSPYQHSTVTIAAGKTLTVRGDITSYSTAEVYMRAGARLIFDSSQAADTPGCPYNPGDPKCKPIYGMGGTISTYGSAGVDTGDPANGGCSAAARCTISYNTSGNVAQTGTWSWYNQGWAKVRYTDITMGDEITPWLNSWTYAAGGGTTIIDNCRFTNSGSWHSDGYLGGAMVTTVTNNSWESSRAPAGLMASLITWGVNGHTTGSTTFTRNVFDLPLNKWYSATNLAGVRYEDNYAGRGIWYSIGASWGSFQRNFVRIVPDDYVNGVDGPMQEWGGDAYDVYLLKDAQAQNWHATRFSTTTSSTVDGLIVGTSEPADTFDSGEVFVGNTSLTYTQNVNYYIRNSIVLPAADGYSYSELASISLPSGGQYGKYYVTNNTWIGGMSGPSNATGFAFLQINETTMQFTGQYQQVASNILWNPNPAGQTAPRPFYVVETRGYTSLSEDTVLPAGADYNWKWNHTNTNYTLCPTVCTNQGNGYVSKFSVTPGAHDKTGDPQFIDYKRNVELFSSKYLGYSTGSHPVGETWSAWTAGTAYAQGAFVTSAAAGYYWGLPINYRCHLAAGCPADIQPGSTAGWRGYWEFDSLYRLRKSNGADYALPAVNGALTPYMPSTCSASAPTLYCQMMAWVRQGYSPTHPLAKGAGLSGVDPGAVPWTSASSAVFPLIWVGW